MAEFNKKYLDAFLGVVRKYMQVRGAMTQKDLAEITEVGVSTMSRFLSQKTNELNPQLIARIVAKLNMPLHEIIDFVDESFSEKFVKLVKFYKEESGGFLDSPSLQAAKEEQAILDTASEETKTITMTMPTTTAPAAKPQGNTSFKEQFDQLSSRQKAFVIDFLSLDPEDKDLLVDVANPLIRYARQKRMQL